MNPHRERVKQAKRKLQKLYRRLTVDQVCPVCGCDVRESCEHVAQIEAAREPA